MGGEILSPNQERPMLVNTSWAREARNSGITFMICEQWLRYATLERIKEHSMACGYKFRVTAFMADAKASMVTVTNTGVAPIYYETFVTVNGVCAVESLKYLQSGETRTFRVKSGGDRPSLTIECDRLVAEQAIEFDADLR